MESTKVIVGLGSCGIAAGAAKVFEKIRALKEAEELDIELKKTSCIGMCYREPLVEVIDETGSYLYGEVDEGRAIEILDKHIGQHNPIKEYVVKTDLFKTPDDEYNDSQVKIVLRNCGYIDPESWFSSQNCWASRSVSWGLYCASIALFGYLESRAQRRGAAHVSGPCPASRFGAVAARNH